VPGRRAVPELGGLRPSAPDTVAERITGELRERRATS
jgi:hypothetical protein